MTDCAGIISSTAVADDAPPNAPAIDWRIVSMT